LHGLLTNINTNSGEKIKFGPPPPGPLGAIFEGDSADRCAGKFPIVLMGGRAMGLACADLGARAPIGASGIAF
jgi:hypothetical protein